MFKRFHNEDNKLKIVDKIFMYRQSKWNYCLDFLSGKPETIFLGWFDETIAALENLIDRNTHPGALVLNARTVHRSQVEGLTILFIEHHPMKSKEETIFKQLELKEVTVLSALDEPLLIKFGSEKLINIMQSLGMKEDEIIEHKMVSQSIANAQEKIEKKIIVEQTVRSQEEWMERNFS